MKKIIAFLFILVALAVVAAYIFIPSKIKIKAVAESTMNIKAAERYLKNGDNWPKWWPGTKAFNYNNTDFSLTKKLLNRFELDMVFKTDSFKSTVQLVPLDNNNTGYTWACEFESSKNPFIRWMQYYNARQIKNNLNALTDSLRTFIDKPENVYGFNVQKVKVSDSVLISTNKTFKNYPDEKEIDTLIQQLRNYISSLHAAEKNYPMLNVHRNGADEYEAEVAIATDILLPATNDFSPKRVLKGGNILEAAFKGGPAAVRKAFEEFENYRSDLELPSPAIPYQLLVTDRIKEADTTKWVTKFYYPVF